MGNGEEVGSDKAILAANEYVNTAVPGKAIPSLPYTCCPQSFNFSISCIKKPISQISFSLVVFIHQKSFINNGLYLRCTPSEHTLAGECRSNVSRSSDQINVI
jgi:hypothetical protein